MDLRQKSFDYAYATAGGKNMVAPLVQNSQDLIREREHADSVTWEDEVDRKSHFRQIAFSVITDRLVIQLVIS